MKLVFIATRQAGLRWGGDSLWKEQGSPGQPGPHHYSLPAAWPGGTGAWDSLRGGQRCPQRVQTFRQTSHPSPIRVFPTWPLGPLETTGDWISSPCASYNHLPTGGFAKQTTEKSFLPWNLINPSRIWAWPWRDILSPDDLGRGRPRPFEIKSRPSPGHSSVSFRCFGVNGTAWWDFLEMRVTILKKLLGRNVSTATPTEQTRRGCSRWWMPALCPMGRRRGWRESILPRSTACTRDLWQTPRPREENLRSCVSEKTGRTLHACSQTEPGESPGWFTEEVRSRRVWGKPREERNHPGPSSWDL